MKKILRDLFGSKKFVVMLSAIIVYVASRFGFEVSPSIADNLLAFVAAYLVGQGIADHGKEAAKITAGEGK